MTKERETYTPKRYWLCKACTAFNKEYKDIYHPVYVTKKQKPYVSCWACKYTIFWGDVNSMNAMTVPEVPVIGFLEET